MNKEEILKMAQTENRGRDVADLDAQRKGAYFAYIIGICLIIAVDIVEGIQSSVSAERSMSCLLRSPTESVRLCGQCCGLCSCAGCYHDG